ncbi:MAG: PqiC family protein [Acetobacteraceae bacterium]|nr:PqiC family protein [Acetobacteraceae bacterium]
MRRRTLVLATPALLVAACSSPDPSYYTLAPIRGAALPGAPSLVELRRPGIAGYLDRSEITRSNTPYQLKVATGERWGEPFGDMVGRVLAEDLNSRLAGSSVFTSAGAISADAGARVEIDIQRFDADAGGQIVLAAQVAITRNNNRAEPITRPIRVMITPAGPSTAAYVAAMSQALARASDDIAALLRRR